MEGIEEILRITIREAADYVSKNTSSKFTDYVPQIINKCK